MEGVSAPPEQTWWGRRELRGARAGAQCRRALPLAWGDGPLGPQPAPADTSGCFAGGLGDGTDLSSASPPSPCASLPKMFKNTAVLSGAA